jgi:hypothetical protein
MVNISDSQRPAAASLTAFLWIEAAACSMAALVHGGLLMPGYAHAAARSAETVIACVLVLALAFAAFMPRMTRRLALAAQGSALLGTLVGAFTIAVGVGPQSRADAAYHSLLLMLLPAGLVSAWRFRT